MHRQVEKKQNLNNLKNTTGTQKRSSSVFFPQNQRGERKGGVASHADPSDAHTAVSHQFASDALRTLGKTSQASVCVCFLCTSEDFLCKKRLSIVWKQKHHLFPCRERERERERDMWKYLMRWRFWSCSSHSTVCFCFCFECTEESFRFHHEEPRRFSAPAVLHSPRLQASCFTG